MDPCYMKMPIIVRVLKPEKTPCARCIEQSSSEKRESMFRKENNEFTVDLTILNEGFNPEIRVTMCI